MLEKLIKELHPTNILLILVTLEVFHFEISGNEINDLHPQNIELILVILVLLNKDDNKFSFLNLFLHKSVIFEIFSFFIEDIDNLKGSSSSISNPLYKLD